jgi:cholesterol transport system auxiliary component
MRTLLALLAPLAMFALAACVSVGIGGEPAPQAYYLLHDATTATPSRRAPPLVDALLIQPTPAGALADTVSIAYSRHPYAYGYYQFAFWTERPVRQLPRLLQQRLEARGIAAAVGIVGEPLRADWLLAIGVDTLHHDVSAQPGQARFVLTAELFDRRSRTRIARRQFEASAPTARADSAAAAIALSQAVGQVFDALLPWLEDELQRAAPAAAR